MRNAGREFTIKNKQGKMFLVFEAHIVLQMILKWRCHNIGIAVASDARFSGITGM